MPVISEISRSVSSSNSARNEGRALLVGKLVEQLEGEGERFLLFRVLMRPSRRWHGQAPQLGDVVASVRRSASMISRDSHSDSSEPRSQIRRATELAAPPMEHQEDLLRDQRSLALPNRRGERRESEAARGRECLV